MHQVGVKKPIEAFSGQFRPRRVGNTPTNHRDIVGRIANACPLPIDVVQVVIMEQDVQWVEVTVHNGKSAQVGEQPAMIRDEVTNGREQALNTAKLKQVRVMRLPVVKLALKAVDNVKPGIGEVAYFSMSIEFAPVKLGKCAGVHLQVPLRPCGFYFAGKILQNAVGLGQQGTAQVNCKRAWGHPWRHERQHVEFPLQLACRFFPLPESNAEIKVFDPVQRHVHVEVGIALSDHRQIYAVNLLHLQFAAMVIHDGLDSFVRWHLHLRLSTHRVLASTLA